MWFLNKYFIRIVSLGVLSLILFYLLLSYNNSNNDRNIFGIHKIEGKTNFHATLDTNFYRKVLNIWCIFTKVTENAPLQFKFQNLIKSLIAHSSNSLHIHVICDNFSKTIAKKILDNVSNSTALSVVYSFYDVKSSAQKINDIVEIMTPYFSSQPGKFFNIYKKF